MYRVSIELYKHEWKFGRTRNAVGTRAAGECFHSFFELRKVDSSRLHFLKQIPVLLLVLPPRLQLVSRQILI